MSRSWSIPASSITSTSRGRRGRFYRTWSRTTRPVRSERRSPTIPRPTPMRIAGSPTSSGIICAVNYRWLQLGLNRGWRAIGTRSTVDRWLQLGLNRGWRAIGTRSTVDRWLQLGLNRGWRAIGTRSTVDRWLQLGLNRGWRAIGTRSTVDRWLQLGLNRGWRAIGTRSTVDRWLQLGLNRGWRAIGTRSTVDRWLQLGLNRGWRAIGTRSTVDARALMMTRVRRPGRAGAAHDARGEQSMDLGLRGKVALVTAASKGMGKACSLGFAAEGARVAMCARTEGDIKNAAEEVRAKTGAEVLAMTADVTKAEDVKSIVARTKQTFGRIDVLVANCGGPPRGELHQMTDEQWYRAFEVSLLSVVRLVREVAPLMREHKWGRILTIH